MKIVQVLLFSSILAFSPTFAHSASNLKIKEVYDQYEGKYPSFPNLYICSGHGCKFIDKVTINKEVIDSLTVFFKDVKTAEDERTAIAGAIAHLETIIGKVTKTNEDKKSFGMFTAGLYGQLDCVDEALNSTTYLLLLESLNLLKYHIVSHPDWKVGFFRWNHYAATFIEKETKVRWALDSGVENNGGKPLIVTWDNFYE